MSCGCETRGDAACGCPTALPAVSHCPGCGLAGRKVSAVTVASQLKKEVLPRYADRAETFNFCTNPACPHVYYDDSGAVAIGQEALRTRVTIKDDAPSTPLCYCKKLLKSDFYKMLEEGVPDVAGAVKAIIGSGKSFCEKSNPKGVCCTEDVRVFLSRHGLAWDDAGAGGCC